MGHRKQRFCNAKVDTSLFYFGGVIDSKLALLVARKTLPANAVPYFPSSKGIGTAF